MKRISNLTQWHKTLIPALLLIGILFPALSLAPITHAATTLPIPQPNGPSYINSHEVNNGKQPNSINSPNAITNPNNSGIQYADSHWNWDWYDPNNHGTVSSGSPQPNFGCAEFVSRSLAAEGVINLDPNAPQSSYSDYVYNGTNYYLWNTGTASVVGLYDYLVDNGFGTDIGDNPAQASPGDPVFYYIGAVTAANRDHVELLVATGTTPGGSDTLADSHNAAAYHLAYWNSGYYDNNNNFIEYARSIVHLKINSSPTYSSPTISTHEEYAIGQDQRLYNYEWSLGNPNWVPYNVSPAGVALIGTPSGHVMNQNGSITNLVYATGTDGIVHEYVSTQSGVWNNGAPLPAPTGVTFNWSPSSLSYSQGGVWHHSIFVIGSDGHLYNWWGPPDKAWIRTDLTSTSATLTGTPSAHWFVQNGNIVQDVYAIGTDGSIHEFVSTNSGSWANNFIPLAPPAGVTFTGTPLAFTYTQDGTTDLHHSVFAMGNNGHLYNYWGPPSVGWTGPTDISGSSGTTLTGSPSGGPAYQSTCSIQTVYATGADNLVHEYVYNGGDGNGGLCGISSSVGWFNGTTLTPNNGWTATGSPMAFNYILSGTTALRHSIFFATSAGTLEEFYWVQGDTWHTADHGAPSSTTLSSSPNGYAY